MINDLIIKALEIDQAKYNWLVFNTGLDFLLKKLCFNDTQLASSAAESKQFWVWWRNQWSLRDKTFVYQTALKKQALPLDAYGLRIATEIYREAHDLEQLRLQPTVDVHREVALIIRTNNQRRIEELKTMIYAKK